MVGRIGTGVGVGTEDTGGSTASGVGTDGTGAEVDGTAAVLGPTVGVTTTCSTVTIGVGMSASSFLKSLLDSSTVENILAVTADPTSQGIIGRKNLITYAPRVCLFCSSRATWVSASP